ncbi:MAG: type VI secretion system tip protein VgrG [Bryobacteraceae bacterium]|nr:type VI secretion system tip protein VgrG [Bryobacteraceae bacterium]
MFPLRQTDRLFYLETPLGPDKLLVRSATIVESISDAFRVRMVLVSDDFNIPFDRILKKNVTLSIRQSDNQTLRCFNGHISKFKQTPPPGRLAQYEAEMVPWLWFLDLSADCLVYYQGKTVPQIVEDTFQRYGLTDYDLRLQRPHAPWDYCCQYRESAFSFVNRLMEIEGIFYYFRQEMGRHTLVATDSNASLQPCPYQARFRYEHAFGPGFKRDEDTVFHWYPERSVRPGRYTHKEYNYEIPNDPLLKNTDTTVASRLDSRFDVYDYPGEYEYNQEAIDWGKLRAEEVELDYDVIKGTSNCRSMMPGYRFQLTEHERDDQNGGYLVTSVTHTAHEGAFLPGADSGEPFYENQFTCIPDSVPYRPPRKTERAQMLGSQTAVVVGPKGEEIYTDPVGRVKVQFHWDRKGNFDENSSCWIRVMQPWADAGFGHIWIPRIGQEVIVDFLEGDPDRPLITGCVYNYKNLPPYKLPDHQTIGGVKTRSSKGGSDSTYNEIRLDDKMGEELFAIQAERDLEIVVKRDTKDERRRDEHYTLRRDQMELIERDVHLTVRGERRDAVEGDRSTKIGGEYHVKVNGDCFIETAGNLYLKAGGRIILDAGGGVSFLGNGSFIDVNASGIVIEGPMVWINCGKGQPASARTANPQTPNLPEIPGPPPAPSVPPPPSFPQGGSGSGSGGAAGGGFTSSPASGMGSGAGSAGGSGQGSGSGGGSPSTARSATGATGAGAVEYTSGGIVRFVPGSSPQSSPLAAHEATHVMQQRPGGEAPPSPPGPQTPAAGGPRSSIGVSIEGSGSEASGPPSSPAPPPPPDLGSDDE